MMSIALIPLGSSITALANNHADCPACTFNRAVWIGAVLTCLCCGALHKRAEGISSTVGEVFQQLDHRLRPAGNA